MQLVGKVTSNVIDRVYRTASHYYGPYWRDCLREPETKCEQTLGGVFKMYTVAPIALLISPFYSWVPTTEVQTQKEPEKKNH